MIVSRIRCLRDSGIKFFSVTGHDDIKSEKIAPCVQRATQNMLLELRFHVGTTEDTVSIKERAIDDYINKYHAGKANTSALNILYKAYSEEAAYPL